MSWTFRSLNLHKLTVVGSGQIGPDIALFFARALEPFGVPIVVYDISDAALERGRSKVVKKVMKGVEPGTPQAERAAQLQRSITFTSDLAVASNASWVVEAATEGLSIKTEIFSRFFELCPGAIFSSNSSHLEPERIFEKLPSRQRCLVTHYFFPADRNPLIELVPSTETDPMLMADLMALFETLGKVPIQVKSRYGYAVDPIFEGLFLAAVLSVEAGLGSVKEVDHVARAALKLGVGPFTAMNLTGGNAITHPALGIMSEKFGGFWRSPKLVAEAMETRAPWAVAERDETVDVPRDRARAITDAMRGAYFGLVGQILDSGITSPSDLEMALELGLDMAPPFALMNELGVSQALALVQAFAKWNPGFTVPACLVRQAATGRPWRVSNVLRRDENGIAVLTIRRPKVLNALSLEVYEDLEAQFRAIQQDPRVQGVVLTGFGTRAFVSGADVGFLNEMETPEMGFRGSEKSKVLTNVIEDLGKPVVAALGGMALGGGLELALACHARLCKRGLKIAAGAPEVNLGIIPGSGGTQRLPRVVGVERAADLMRTGRTLSSAEAVAIGLCREEVEGDVVRAAIDLASAAALGRVKLPALSPAPLQVPATLPAVDLGHLSRATDAILCRAILEGCKKPLKEGLRFESEMFGECTKTEDMKIGLGNFLKNGPRAAAVFVHR